MTVTHKSCMALLLLALLLAGCTETTETYSYCDPVTIQPDGTTKTVAPNFIYVKGRVFNTNEITGIRDTEYNNGCQIVFRNGHFENVGGVSSAQVYRAINKANNQEASK